jgi:hypothetical protein
MSTDDDDRARDAADSCFIQERLRALDKTLNDKATEDAYHRIILDLLRSRTPGPHTLRLVAGELERLWWPNEYKQHRRRSRAAAGFRVIEDLINYVASQHRQGERRPRTEAEMVVAESFGIEVEGLRKRRYRYRKRAGL